MNAESCKKGGREYRARTHHRRWSLLFGLIAVSILLGVWISGLTSFGLLLIAAFFALAAVISFVLSFFGLEPDGYDLTQSMGQMGQGFARGLRMEESSRSRPPPPESSDRTP